MLPFNDPSDPSNPISPVPANVTRVHVVKPLAEEGGSEARPEPLHIEYSTTRVLADAQGRLMRSEGVVKPDRSALSETFKMLRSQVLQRMRGDHHKLLAVTSPRRIRGKSLTALNLALSLSADLDTAVVLVDADLSGRGLQRLFGLDAEPGLVEHLTRGTPIAELLVNPGIARFVLLPAGREEGLRSAELLATKALQHLITEMKQRYQDRYIIVDLPPLLDTADALAFLPQVDTTLVVVEEGTTSIRDIETATEMLAPFNLIGTVMSKPPLNAGHASRPWYRRLTGR